MKRVFNLFCINSICKFDLYQVVLVDRDHIFPNIYPVNRRFQYSWIHRLNILKLRCCNWNHCSFLLPSRFPSNQLSVDLNTNSVDNIKLKRFYPFLGHRFFFELDFLPRSLVYSRSMSSMDSRLLVLVFTTRLLYITYIFIRYCTCMHGKQIVKLNWI